VAIIVVGVFIAGSRDFSFDLGGYSVVLLSNLTTAIYLATIARLGKTTGLNSFGLMWCNGTTTAPKITSFVQFYWHSPMDIICISTGWILCWESVILLIRYNSRRPYK